MKTVKRLGFALMMVFVALQLTSCSQAKLIKPEPEPRIERDIVFSDYIGKYNVYETPAEDDDVAQVRYILEKAERGNYAEAANDFENLAEKYELEGPFAQFPMRLYAASAEIYFYDGRFTDYRRVAMVLSDIRSRRLNIDSETTKLVDRVIDLEERILSIVSE